MISSDRKWTVSTRTRLLFYCGLLAITIGFSSLVWIVAHANWLFRNRSIGVAQDFALLIFLMGFIGEFIALFSFLADNSSRKQRPWWIQ